MKRLSVIIPMYNVEKYVERCIRSLENQDIPPDEYEIICINDGSPDNCRSIIALLQEEFSNIILIDQENKGVSAARNNGISVATGKYMLMIDPDDYVAENSFNEVLSYAERTNLDVVYLGFAIYNADGKTLWQTEYGNLAGNVFYKVEGYYADRKDSTRDPDRSWAMLYSSDMIDRNKIRYPVNVPYLEDGLFLVKIFATANTTGFMDLIFYKRTVRPGSATNSKLFFSERAVNGFILAAKDLRDFRGRHQFSKEQSDLIQHGIVNFVLLSLFPLVRISTLKRFRETCKKLEKEGFGKLDLDGVVEPYLSYAKKYNISPLLFAASYWNSLARKKILTGWKEGLINRQD